MDHYNTHSYLRKVKKKSKSEKMISFPFATRPIFAFLFYEKTLLVVVLENIMIIVN